VIDPFARRGRPLVAAVCALVLWSCEVAGLDDTASVTRVDYKISNATPPPMRLNISGELRTPNVTENPEGKVPAVVIVHGARGIDGTGVRYAAALNGSGIATLEIDMFGPRGLPSSAALNLIENLPDVFGALGYLVAHSSIDPGRIGVMGVSWGGGLAVMTAVKRYIRLGYGGEFRFAAHVGVYPACHVFHDSGAYSDVAEGRWSGAPVLILAAALNDFEAPDSCPNFVAELPEDVRGHVSQHVYPGVTYGFDGLRGPRTYFDRFAHFGRGGYVSEVPDPLTSQDARQKVVGFFRKAFGMAPVPEADAPPSSEERAARSH